MQPRKSDTLPMQRGLSRSSRYPRRCILPSAALSSPSPIYARSTHRGRGFDEWRMLGVIAGGLISWGRKGEVGERERDR